MQQVSARWIWLCAVVLLSGCPRAGSNSDEASAARSFYNLPVTEQLRTFRQHPLENQLDLFLFGNQIHHPPAIYLARCFALSGAAAVELLRSKLNANSDDLTVRDITLLLANIDAMSKYDVTGDAQLMATLKSRIAQMRDAGWRDTAEQKFASIGQERNEHAGQAPECG